jgi:hypothetical protein
MNSNKRKQAYMKNNNNKLYLKQWIYLNFDIFEKLKKQRTLFYRVIFCFLTGLFNGSFAASEEFLFKQYGKDCIRYVISRCKLPLTLIRIEYEKFIIRLAIRLSKDLDVPIGLSIDDMIEPKDVRSQEIVKGGKKCKKVGFSFVTGVLVIGYIHLPLLPRLAFRKSVCEELGIIYRSKIEIAIEMLFILSQLGLSGNKIVVLMDSWYTSEKVLKAINELNFIIIGRIKSNRKINKKQIESYTSFINKSNCTKLDSSDYVYYLFSQTGTLNKINYRYRILLSNRQSKKKGDQSWRYIICSDLSISGTDILQWYDHRWAVETFHQIWQHRYCMNKWRVWGIERLKRLATLSVISMGFASYYVLKTMDYQEIKKLTYDNQSIIAIGLLKIKTKLILENCSFDFEF